MSEYCVRIVYGGSVYVTVDRTTMLEEGHFLVGETPDGFYRISSCDCEGCREADAMKEPIVTAERMGSFIEENHGMIPLRLVVAPSMLLPLPSGDSARALKTIGEFAELLVEQGFEVVVTDRAIDHTYRCGDYVRIIVDDFGSGGVPVVAGMIGQIEQDPHALCTPGVSVLLRLVGTNEATGLWCRQIEPTSEPSDEERATTSKKAREAGTIYQSRHGWQGLLVVRGKRVEQAKACAELRALARRLPKLFEGNRTREFAGSLRRAAGLLAGFSLHPQGNAAVVLSEQFNALRREEVKTEALADLCESVRTWLVTVEEWTLG